MTTVWIVVGAVLFVLAAVLLARVAGRLLWGSGKTPTAREAVRQAKQERWTRGGGGGW